MANNNCKYYKVVRQVSYDSGVTWVNIGETQKGDLYEYNSPACGAVTEYRWVDVTGAYTCEGTTKYQKTKKQYSTDGTTWQDVSPAEYGKGNVIEYQSSDCGYVPPTPASGNYLTFVAIDDGRFKFSNNSVKYSLDEGSTWSTLASDTYSPTVYAGQKIMWKDNLTPVYNVGIGTFSSTGRFNVEGNVMSLLYGDDYEGEINLSGKQFAFHELFYGCTNLISAENLLLPATTLVGDCYEEMFGGCTSLTKAPSLPATTLAPACYFGMFASCTSLTTAPELPATTLVLYCYQAMFQGCTNLNYIKCLATDISAQDCINAWVYYVQTSSGTFVKASSMNSWTTGTSGIPNNWTVQNA